MPLFRDGGFLYSEWLTQHAKSHFSVGLKFLSGPRRRAMQVVYAFCRAVDDVVDRASDRGVAKKELALWRRELEDCTNGFPTHPIAVALQQVIQDYQIPIKHCQAVIDGVEMDLTVDRYHTFADLQIYCERVASAVGLISIRVFGCTHPAAERYARALGIALQLTNIMRDVKNDAQRGRIYLPLEDMKEYAYLEEELMENRASELFRRLMAFEGRRAHAFFQEAEKELKDSKERRKLLPARIMGAVYKRLLAEIEQVHYDVFSSASLSVPRSTQALLAVREILI